jgi:hypothetical protein
MESESSLGHLTPTIGTFASADRNVEAQMTNDELMTKLE